MFDNRVFRCDQTDFYDDEILYCDSTHSDDSLRMIADAGFNGIWLRGKLRELVPGKLFGPHIGKSNERLRVLCSLCKRAAAYDLGVWLYFTEPLGLGVNDPFWKHNRDIAGPRFDTGIEEPMITLCPSTPIVQDYLYGGFEKLFSMVNSKGAILITASEQPSHCFSRVNTGPDHKGSWESSCTCQRCGPKGPIHVISSVINTINTAVRSADTHARVVAWDWAWFLFCKAPYKALIDNLSDDIIIMTDFERGGSVRRLGKKRTIEEYSIMYPGPSSWFLKQVKNTAGKRPLWAKLQINTTHELATVPNMPLVVSLYRKFHCLKQVAIDGFMGSWNFGCATDTLNVFAVQQLSNNKPLLEERSWLLKLAEDFFGGGADSDRVVKAWYAFFKACRYYPLGIANEYLYFGPINYALGYPLKLSFTDRPLGPGWLRHEFGDRLENSLKDITLSQMIDLLRKFAHAWNKAVTMYDTAFAGRSPESIRIQRETGCAHYVGSCAVSTYNIYRWYANRKDRQQDALSKADIEILKAEIDNCRSALPFIEADSRLGFHGEAQWQMVTPEKVKDKIAQIEDHLKRPAEP